VSSIVTVMNSEPRTMSTYSSNYGIIMQHSEISDTIFPIR